MQVDCRSNLSDPDEESPIIKLQEEKNNWLFLSIFYKISLNINTKRFWEISLFNALKFTDRTNSQYALLLLLIICVFILFFHVRREWFLREGPCHKEG